MKPGSLRRYLHILLIVFYIILELSGRLEVLSLEYL